MNVCLVTGGYPPSIRGGAELYVRRLAEALTERGIDVSVITTEPYSGAASLRPTRRRESGVDVWRFFPLNVDHKSTYEQRSVPFQASWRLLDAPNPHAALVVDRILTRVDPDIVHTNNLSGISTLAARVCRSHGVHVHSLHDYNLVCPNSTPRLEAITDSPESLGNDPGVCTLFSRLQRFLLGSPDVVTGPSRDVIAVHRENGFFEGVAAVVVRHGVTRVSNGVPPQSPSPSVLYAGHLSEVKGVAILLAAACSLPEVTFHICGMGPLVDRVNAAAAQRRNVVYHGFLSQDELSELRQRSTVAAVPSVCRETGGLVIYEAFAEGLPVIASSVGGLPEIVTPGVTGALVPPGDVDALTAAIRDLLESPDLTTMKTNALRWANRHTIDEHVDGLLSDVYRTESAPEAKPA